MNELLQYVRKNPELVLVSGIFLGFQISVCILAVLWFFVGGIV